MIYENLILRRTDNPFDNNDINKNNTPVSNDEMDQNLIYLKKIGSYSGDTGITVTSGSSEDAYNLIKLNYDQFGNITINI